MSRFLIALVCLSTLAMAQNRIVASPTPADEIAPSSSEAVVSSASVVGRDVPRPAALAFLIVGLSGLTVAGSRSQRREDRASA